MGLASGPETLALVAEALARGLAPIPPVDHLQWAEENIIVADGPKAGARYSHLDAPYAPMIFECLNDDHPANRVPVRKSVQTGVSLIAICWLASCAVNAPDTSMHIMPTINSAADFVEDKVDPTIDQTEALRRTIYPVKQRSRKGSTKKRKRFDGGYWHFIGANSATDLSMKTVRRMARDEVDRWPAELPGQGDPMELADGRQVAYHDSGDYKSFEFSTPTVKGDSRIDEGFEGGQQIYWEVPCPHCEAHQILEFGTKDSKWGLKFNMTAPHDAHYICRHCGLRIDHHQKRAMVQAGRPVALNPEAPYPSFHIDTLVSLLTTWDKMAEAFARAKDDPRKLRAFFNLWLALPWDVGGSAPEWQRLFSLREDYPARRIPEAARLFTGAADVQQDGIYYEVLAWAQDRQNWCLDWGYLEGDTATSDGPVWAKLDEVLARRYEDAHGNFWPVDAFAIDAGYNTNTVYLWAARHPKVYAVMGEDGWARAAISRAPSKVDVTRKGKKRRRGAELWHVGTWSLKAEFYGNLRKEGMAEGQDEDPPGYCHFAQFHDERYLKQITAEKLAVVMERGRSRRRWVESGPNHLLDCRIYNAAMAEHLGLSRMTAADWAWYDSERGAPNEDATPDLVDQMSGGPPARSKPSKAKRRRRGFAEVS